MVYRIPKIRKLALEELPRKKNGIHMCTDQQSTALTESPAEFAELSLPDRSISVPLLQPYFISDP